MTKAQALLAVAALAQTEADETFYAYPPALPDEYEEANRLANVAQAAHEAADAAGATDDDWTRVMRWLGRVDPANPNSIESSEQLDG